MNNARTTRRFAPTRLTSVISLGMLVCVAGCDRAEQVARKSEIKTKARPNIILITACTFRYDFLRAAGYDRPTTPFLDSLAKKGVFFENAISASTWTQPSTVSILTGLTPNVHRMTQYQSTGDVTRGSVAAKRTLPNDVVTIAELLSQAGYATFGRINNVQAGHFFNIPQGFDDGATTHTLKTPGMMQALGSWLAQREDDRPFFAFLMTRDAHFMYRPRYDYYLRFNRSDKTLTEDEYDSYPARLHEQVKGFARSTVPARLQRAYVDLYAGAIAQLDDALSALPSVLQEAGCASNTVIVFTADHGERFFERGRHSDTGHGWEPYEEVVHVPLIVSGTGIPSGRRIAEVVRTIDIFPTLAALADAEVPDVVQGRSLLPIVRGDSAALSGETAFASFTRGSTTVHMVRDLDYKLFSDGRLFDLANDPDERLDVFRQNADSGGRLRKELTRWLDQEADLRSRVVAGEKKELTSEVVEQLRSLGYLGDD